jgi:hypothetical protein
VCVLDADPLARAAARDADLQVARIRLDAARQNLVSVGTIAVGSIVTTCFGNSVLVYVLLMFTVSLSWHLWCAYAVKRAAQAAIRRLL